VGLVLNCAYNAVSALGRSRYARMVATPPVRRIMGEAVAEIVALGASEAGAPRRRRHRDKISPLEKARPCADFARIPKNTDQDKDLDISISRLGRIGRIDQGFARAT
jgi:Ketopantoate reductase PanE/ApbA C terminal